MNLPKGEQLIITIDRVVERDCWSCDGYGGTSDVDCMTCHGTGKRKVRLRGWVEVEPLIGEGCGWLVATFITVSRLSMARHVAVAAFLKGELPDEIADNIEEVTDG